MLETRAYKEKEMREALALEPLNVHSNFFLFFQSLMDYFIKHSIFFSFANPTFTLPIQVRCQGQRPFRVKFPLGLTIFILKLVGWRRQKGQRPHIHSMRPVLQSVYVCFMVGKTDLSMTAVRFSWGENVNY